MSVPATPALRSPPPPLYPDIETPPDRSPVLDELAAPDLAGVAAPKQHSAWVQPEAIGGLFAQEPEHSEVSLEPFESSTAGVRTSAAPLGCTGLVVLFQENVVSLTRAMLDMMIGES
jgi:hypothetical protein